MEQQVFENLLVYSVFILLKIVKFYSTSLIQAVARLRSRRFRHSDDAAFLENKRSR